MIEQLGSRGEVCARRMFVGAGLYRDGKVCGLVAEDVAYLNVDDSNRATFERAGSSASKHRANRETVVPCREIPGDALENPDELARRARRSFSVRPRGTVF